MTKAAGKVDDHLKKLAEELRGGSHENSSWIKPYQTFKVDDITVEGAWGTSKVTITYDATTGSTSSEEVRWKKVGANWYMASPCDEEDEETEEDEEDK
jgi:hypothetical protein